MKNIYLKKKNIYISHLFKMHGNENKKARSGIINTKKIRNNKL